MTHALPHGTYLGTETATRACATLTASEHWYPSGSDLPPHVHRNPYLSFVVAGGYTERIGRRSIRCERYMLRYHHAGEEHANRFDADGGVCFNLELTPTWNDALDELQLDSDHPLQVESAAWLGVQARQAARRIGAAAELDLESLTGELLGRCARAQRTLRVRMGPSVIARVIAMIEDTHPLPSLTALAREVQLHPTHLARAFRRAMGCTIGEFARERRVCRAELALRTSLKSISWIAAATGFADHAHLSRSFRSVVGTTPSRYRAELAAPPGR